MIDVALISLYNRLSNRIDVDLKEIRRSGAILATGEFGRRHLGPFSPITLLFLQTSDAPFEEEAWRANIVEPLEQAGWDVQFQTATIDEAVKLGLNNFDWLGGILDSRFISGSRTLMNDLRVLLTREIDSNRDWQSIKIFLEEWQERHNGQGDPAFILEPDLEYSAGSLGELNRIRWASYLLNGGDSSSETDSLDPDSSSALKKAERFLLRVRNHLQLLRERQETQLQYEAQQQVALRLGYQDQGDFLAVEIMMKELEGHFYEVRLVANQFRALLRDWVLAAEKEKEKPTTKKVAPGMWVESGRLMIDSQMLASDGEGLLNLFTQAVHLDLYLGAEAYQWAKSQAHQLPGDLEGTSTVRDWLFEIIREENSRIRTLRALYGTRVLSAFVPELREVHALVQHDAFHLHPVHEHHLRTFAELKKLFRGEYDSDFPQVPEWLESIRNKEVLLLAGLIHDVGKGGGHGHAQRGGEMALLIGDRLGLSAEDKELLSFLVANHVLLTDNAARRDIDDEQMLQHCASVIGSVERLKMLAHRLERGDPDTRAVAARLLSLKREVGELLGDEMSKEELDLHFEQLPSRYLVSATPEEVVSQYRLERQLEKAVLSWQVEEKHPIWELTLMSRQPLGLLTMAAGTLTLNQLDIRKAKTHTKKNGVAFQTFEVAALKPSMEISWEQVMADLEKTIQGRLALDYRLAVLAAEQKRERKWVPAKPDEVVVDNHSSDQYTIIEVYTTDRPGLLYSITRTLLDLRLQAFLAKISTRMDQVADIFYVLTQEGQRVEDPEHAEEIKNALLFSLQ
jgi:[protein-PII] uridylyltransferase